jgi:hypothetical protein
VENIHFLSFSMRVEVRYAYVASLHPTISEKNLELLFAAHVLKAKQFFFWQENTSTVHYHGIPP